MKIVVIGGTGLIGKQLVALLRRAGHDVIAASPSSGVNAVTGEGLAQALSGADVVVDVANAPVWEDQAVLEFFEKSSRNLTAGETAAGVKHHIALSVVGTDRMQASGYFRAKLAQKKLIKASPIPYTIVRATQFFEFVGPIADFASDGKSVRLPHATLQPISSGDVAAALAKVVGEQPSGSMIEIAGPEAIPLDDLARELFKIKGDAREVITDASASYYGTPIDDQSLTPGANPRLGPTHFSDWLRETTSTQRENAAKSPA